MVELRRLAPSRSFWIRLTLTAIASPATGTRGQTAWQTEDWPRIILAERDGRIVGLCGIHDENVVALFVDAPAQRQGHRSCSSVRTLRRGAWFTPSPRDMEK